MTLLILITFQFLYHHNTQVITEKLNHLKFWTINWKSVKWFSKEESHKQNSWRDNNDGQLSQETIVKWSLLCVCLWVVFRDDIHTVFILVWLMNGWKAKLVELADLFHLLLRGKIARTHCMVWQEFFWMKRLVDTVFTCVWVDLIWPKNQPKKSSSTYTRVMHQDLTQAIQEISITIAWSLFGKPSL